MTTRDEAPEGKGRIEEELPEAAEEGNVDYGTKDSELPMTAPSAAETWAKKYGGQP